MCRTTHRNSTICAHTTVFHTRCRRARHPSLTRILAACTASKSTEHHYEICAECAHYWRAHGVEEWHAVEKYRVYRRETGYEGRLSPHAYSRRDVPGLLRDGEVETGRRVVHVDESGVGRERGGEAVVPIRCVVDREVVHREREVSGRVGNLPEACKSTSTLWPALNDESPTGRPLRNEFEFDFPNSTHPQQHLPLPQPKIQYPPPAHIGGNPVRRAVISNTETNAATLPQPHYESGITTLPQTRYDPTTTAAVPQYRYDAGPLPALYRTMSIPAPSPIDPSSSTQPLERFNPYRWERPDESLQKPPPTPTPRATTPKTLAELFGPANPAAPAPPAQRPGRLDLNRGRPAPRPRVDGRGEGADLEKPLPRAPRMDSPMPGAPFDSANPERDLPGNLYYRRVI